MKFRLLLLFISYSTLGQRRQVGDDLLWTRYAFSWKISPRYTWIQELDNRTTTSWNRHVQTIYHSHLHRAIQSNQEVALGFSASQANRLIQKEEIAVPELRLFEEWIYRIPLPRQHSLQSKIRLDQRFFLPSEAIEMDVVPPFQFRVRYQAQYRVQLPRQWVWRVSNEWMGHTPATFVFDQNRLATSLEVPLFPNVSLEGGYIWLLSQGRTDRLSSDVFRFTIHHRLPKKKSGHS